MIAASARIPVSPIMKSLWGTTTCIALRGRLVDRCAVGVKRVKKLALTRVVLILNP